MRRTLVILAAAALTGAGMPAVAECATADETVARTGEADVSGQILVRFEDSKTDAEAARIIARVGGREINRLLGGKIYLIEIAYPTAQADIVDALSATEGVVYAEPNGEVSIPTPPDRSAPNDDGDSEPFPLPKVD